MNNSEAIRNYYNNYDEHARLEVRSRLPEYLTTMRYIHKYLRPESKILEIGAGTGRYSLALAEEGYSVDAVELVAHNIEIFKSHMRPNQNVRIFQGNACKLDFIESDSYDIVLLLGPMYHLFTDEDKIAAIREAVRAAKKGGVIFAAYANNDLTIYKLFYKGEITNYISEIDHNFHCKSMPHDVFEVYRKEDIDRIMRSFPVQRLHYVGVDMIRHFLKESIEAFTDAEFDLYMQYHYQICERADMVGLSEHMLDIFRKE